MDRKIDEKQLARERRVLIFKWVGAVCIAIGVVIFIASLAGGDIKRSDLTLGTVDEGPLEITVVASGSIVPAYEEIVNSPVATTVLRAEIQAGDSVKRGETLVQLDLRQERTELDKLKDRVDMMRQELLQQQLTNRTMLSDLEMQIEVQQMQVSRMAIDVDNERRLDSIGSGTGERVRQAETAYQAGKLQLKQMQTKLANERERIVASERVQQLNINGAEKDVEMMESTLHQGTIPAPIDGIVTYLVSDPGTRVGAGERVAVVSDLSQFKIAGEVPAGSSDKVTVGARVDVRVGRGQLQGTVSNITPQAKNGVVQFIVKLDDPRNGRLRSGLRSDMYVNYGYKERVSRLPYGPYYKGRGDYEMFVVDGDDRLVKRKVVLGDGNRDYVEVESGLNVGDHVMTGDMEKFRRKNKLKIKD